MTKVYVSTWYCVYGLHWYFSVLEEGIQTLSLATVTLVITWVILHLHCQGKECLSLTQRLTVPSDLKLLPPISIYVWFHGNSTTSENATFGLCLLLGRFNPDPEDKLLCRFLFSPSRNWRIKACSVLQGWKMDGKGISWTLGQHSKIYVWVFSRFCQTFSYWRWYEVFCLDLDFICFSSINEKHVSDLWN